MFSIGLKDGDRQIRLLTNILPRLNSIYILLYTRQRVIIRGRFLNAKTCCVTVSAYSYTPWHRYTNSEPVLAYEVVNIYQQMSR